MPKATRILASQALRAAGKQLPFASRRDQNRELAFAADDMADAYRIGAEEAQREIIHRLQRLKAKEEASNAD